MLRVFGLLVTLLAAPVSAQTIPVDTYRGEIELANTPNTIAVLDIAALDTLTALGIKAQGIIQPVYLPYLEAAAQGAAPIGSLTEPDFDALAAQQPDLIIAGGHTSSRVSELTEIAPTIDMSIWEDTIGQGLARLATYGTIFNTQDKATSLMLSFAAKLEKTKSILSEKGKALIVVTNGEKLSAYGVGGQFGWLHKSLNLPEAVEGVEQSAGGSTISLEFIRDANPDILLVIDFKAAIGQAGMSAQDVLNSPLVDETKAGQTGHVIYLSSAPILFAAGGIQSMSITLDEILAGM